MNLNWNPSPNLIANAESVTKADRAKREFAAHLQAEPGKWAVVSHHATLNAARGKLHKLRHDANHVDLPVEFLAAEATDPKLGTHCVVGRWKVAEDGTAESAGPRAVDLAPYAPLAAPQTA